MNQKILKKIDETLSTINEAWKNASEEMYKAQAEGEAKPGDTDQASSSSSSSSKDSKSDDVQDVDFEEVKEE